MSSYLQMCMIEFFNLKISLDVEHIANINDFLFALNIFFITFPFLVCQLLPSFCFSYLIFPRCSVLFSLIYPNVIPNKLLNFHSSPAE